jgi:hypothetical protein
MSDADDTNSRGTSRTRLLRAPEIFSSGLNVFLIAFADEWLSKSDSVED